MCYNCDNVRLKKPLPTLPANFDKLSLSKKTAIVKDVNRRKAIRKAATKYVNYLEDNHELISSKISQIESLISQDILSDIAMQGKSYLELEVISKAKDPIIFNNICLKFGPADNPSSCPVYNNPLYRMIYYIYHGENLSGDKGYPVPDDYASILNRTIGYFTTCANDNIIDYDPSGLPLLFLNGGGILEAIEPQLVKRTGGLWGILAPKHRERKGKEFFNHNFFIKEDSNDTSINLIIWW